MIRRLLNYFIKGILWATACMILLANTPFVDHWPYMEMEKTELAEKGKKDVQEEEDSKRKYKEESMGYFLKDFYSYWSDSTSEFYCNKISQYYLEIITPPPES